jgi:AraC family transcriptional regulator of adaptative response / DNA-3-methyladenine glycosylase II
METSTVARAALDRARRSRDPRFDGRFFVGVTSTGVYCRPICPAPSPRESNVRYFPTAAAAADAGFRPCLRCRPEAAPGTPAWLGTSAVVRRALALVHEGALDEGSVDALAARLGIGPRQLHRLFVAHVGAPPLAVAQTRRLHFAKRLIDETDFPMTQIAFASGFSSLRRFNDAFQRTYERPPSALRRLRRADAAPARGEVTLRLAFRPPGGFDDLLEFLRTRAIPGVERVDAGGYARTVALPTGPATVAVSAVRGRNELSLRVVGAPATALLPLTTRARRVFDLASDPATIGAALRADPLLGPLVRRRPGLRIPGAWDTFECAVRAVVGQQVSLAAGRTLVTRLVARAGTRLARPMDGLTHLFPSPEALATADLRGLGLVPARARTLAALGRAVADGRIVLDAPADEVRAALLGLPGVGEWTAEYVALRALGEPDAFPAADLVLRRVAGEGLTLTARALAERAEAWRPWRGYAAVHLWGAAASRALSPRPSRREQGD